MGTLPLSARQICPSPLAKLLYANPMLTPTLLTPAACVDSGPGGVRVLQHDMVHSRSILAEVSVQASVDQVLLCKKLCQTLYQILLTGRPTSRAASCNPTSLLEQVLRMALS